MAAARDFDKPGSFSREHRIGVLEMAFSYAAWRLHGFRFGIKLYLDCRDESKEEPGYYQHRALQWKAIAVRGPVQCFVERASGPQRRHSCRRHILKLGKSQ